MKNIDFIVLKCLKIVKMNSTEDLSLNHIVQEEATGSNRSTNSDSNANLSNNTNQSKGAIPKIKNPIKVNNKKSSKYNNNVEEMTSVKNICPSDEILTMNGDVIRLNGVTDKMRLSTSYSDDYPRVICDSFCSGLNRNSNHFDDIPLIQVLNTSTSVCENLTTTSPTYQDASVNVEKNQVKIDSDSSSDDNELLSISDDGCIYTYKGDQAADLPSSFFTLDEPPVASPEVNVLNRDQNSPEMDYLEMDFDPGPSGDADSDCGSNAELEAAENLPEDENVVEETQIAENVVVNRVETKIFEEKPCCSKDRSNILCDFAMPGPSTSQQPLVRSCPVLNQPLCPPVVSEKIKKLKMPWSCTIANRTCCAKTIRSSRRHQNSLGELFSPSEKVLSPSSDFAKATCNEDFKSSTMIWSIREATIKQVSQIGMSACGATAVLNVLNALRLPIPPIEKLQEAVSTRLRANSSPLPEYLMSRSVAGCTHVDIIKGLETLSEGTIFARFFHMFPERLVNLHTWLGFWISHGAVPVATLNLQKCSGPIPDAWHHQMIYGVGPEGVYLTNPVECVEAEQLWPQLCSESELMIRREDVLSRWNFRGDLPQLMNIADPTWRKINVVGQVANLIRESQREGGIGFTHTTHIKIPASYSSGITLVINVNSPVFPLLKLCPELPLLETESASACFTPQN